MDNMWAGGIPKDEWLLAEPINALKQWLRNRISGSDGKWSPRDGDEPQALIHALLRRRVTGDLADQVRDRLIHAIAEILEGFLSSSFLHDTDPELDAFLELTRVSGSVTSSFATNKLRMILDRTLLRLDIREQATLAKSLLRARAPFRPALDRGILTDCLRVRELAVAAFHCTLNSDRDADRREAFTALVEIGREVPLLQQAKMFRKLFPNEFESMLQSLQVTPDPVVKSLGISQEICASRSESRSGHVRPGT